MRQPPPGGTTPRTLPRVLVARLDSAGDVLLAGPAVRAGPQAPGPGPGVLAPSTAGVLATAGDILAAGRFGRRTAGECGVSSSRWRRTRPERAAHRRARPCGGAGLAERVRRARVCGGFIRCGTWWNWSQAIPGPGSGCT